MRRMILTFGEGTSPDVAAYRGRGIPSGGRGRCTEDSGETRDFIPWGDTPSYVVAYRGKSGPGLKTLPNPPKAGRGPVAEVGSAFDLLPRQRAPVAAVEAVFAVVPKQEITLAVQHHLVGLCVQIQ